MAIRPLRPSDLRKPEPTQCVLRSSAGVWEYSKRELTDMRSIVSAAILALIAQIYPIEISAQTKAPPTKAPQPAARGQRGAAKAQPALTLRQVIESLISL